MEFLPKGSLDTILRKEKESITYTDLLVISKHIAAGMQYLEERSIVHRDLALRNLLVGSRDQDKYHVKVSDFGLSRSMQHDYYKTDDRTIPVKWSAIEVLEQGISTSKSDIWSFGIVLWELYSFGTVPYTGMSNLEVIAYVKAGSRLSEPESCPPEIYFLMKRCWKREPQDRPTFKELSEILANLCMSQYDPNGSRNNFLLEVAANYNGEIDVKV